MSDFHKQFIKLQKTVKVLKENFNSFGRYNFRSCEDILAEAKPIACELGLALILSDEIFLIGDRYYVKATALVTDGDKSYSNSALAREAHDKKGMDEAQVTGSASSYARKYALSGLLGLDDEKDADVPSNNEKRIGSQREAVKTIAIDKVENVQEREATIELIRQRLSSFTEGFDSLNKAKAMKDLCSVNNFAELKNKTLAELKIISQKIMDTIKERDDRNKKPSFKING